MILYFKPKNTFLGSVYVIGLINNQSTSIKFAGCKLRLDIFWRKLFLRLYLSTIHWSNTAFMDECYSKRNDMVNTNQIQYELINVMKINCY